MIKKAALYIRVSTTEQAEHGYSIEEQRDRLNSYCHAMGWTVVAVYIDGGYSGADTDRPGLQKMLSELKNTDAVVVYKLDRLSRRQRDTLTIIEDSFLKNKIEFVSLQENLDTSTPAGRMMIGILASFAQLEREVFAERSKLGRTGRAKKGKWIGTSRPPIGYDYDPATQELTINEHEAAQVRQVFDLYQAGTGLQRIAEIMHGCGYVHKYGDWLWWGGVITMLKNPVYVGKVMFDGQYFDGSHNPIISQEQFDAVQAMLGSRKSTQPYKRKSPFGHLLECGNCGAKLFWRHKKDREPKYQCYSRYGKPKGMVKDANCKLRIWPAHEIDNAILQEITSLATNRQKLVDTFVGKQKKPRHSNLAGLQKQVAELDKQIGKLIDLYQHDILPVNELNDRIKKLHKEKSSIQGMIDSIQVTDINSKNRLDIASKAAHDIYHNWDNIEITAQMELLDMLIDKVVVSDTGLDIIWAGGVLTND